MIKELIQNILVYVVIVSVLRGLITNPKYMQYFQFLSGMIMILLMLGPLLTVLSYENKWYDLLEENILKMDMEEIKEEMKIAEDHFQDIVKTEYINTVKEQVIAMAEKDGITLSDVDVALCMEKDEYKIDEISGTATSEKRKKNEDDISVETIQIETDKDNKHIGEEENDSRQAKTLRKEISAYFVIGEEKVHLWK